MGLPKWALWLVPMIAVFACGAVVGLGVYTFHFAKGSSYLTNDPAACANCHIMRDYYDGWLKGSHKQVAVCNDCHAPADFVGKYATKALNGYNHSVAFTFGTYQDVLAATPLNKRITEDACRVCHVAVVSAIDAHATANGDIKCVRCHANVGHL